MCKSKQENNCKVSDVSKKLMSKLDRCNFEGALTSDPKSVVSLVGCLDENGSADISVVSQKVVADRHHKYASCDHLCYYRQTLSKVCTDFIKMGILKFQTILFLMTYPKV